MNETILSVSELTGQIKRKLEDDFDYVTVRGEISNLTRHSSGHKYFSIKDENAQISCVMWRTRKMSHEITNGMKVLISGRLSVYPPRGSYQIDCYTVNPEGEGDLYLAYKALFAKLEKKGYFDPAHKKLLPQLPIKIGIATSPTGAAYQDMLTTIKRRLPICEIHFRATLCQGESAAEDIVRAIEDFQNTGVDVLIIGRGGGSLEDLWPFNMEIVADAIYTSNIPIVSGVGHEPDFTISDYVADIRAATPTAAGEVVTPTTKDDFFNQFNLYADTLTESVVERINNYKQSIHDFLNEYSIRKFSTKLSEKQQFIDDIDTRLTLLINRNYKTVVKNFKAVESHLNSLNPLTPLNRGFALLKSNNGRYLSNNDALSIGDEIIIERLNEEAETKIKNINKR